MKIFKIAAFLITLLIAAILIYKTNFQEKEKVSTKIKTTLNPRGSIYSADGVLLQEDQEVYKAMLLNKVPKRELKDLLDNISEIIEIDKERVYRQISNNQLYVVLSYKLNKSEAQKLDDFAKKLANVELENSSGEKYWHKLLFTQFSGYKRVSPQGELLTPYIGNTNKFEIDNFYTLNRGMSGVERSYDKELSSGKDINLTVSIDAQKELEKEVDQLKEKYKAKEVSAVVLNIDSGEINSIASTKRFNPSHIKLKQFKDVRATLTNDIFNVDQFMKPFNNVDIIALSKTFKYSDLQFKDPIKDQNNTIKMSFFQLLLNYSIFFNDGVLKTYNLAKNSTTESKKLLNSSEIDRDKALLYLNGKDVVLEFKERNESATLYMEYINDKKENYLKGIFLIHE